MSGVSLFLCLFFKKIFAPLREEISWAVSVEQKNTHAKARGRKENQKVRRLEGWKFRQQYSGGR